MKRYKKLFKEYFVKEGSTLDEVLTILNVFSDTLEEPLSKHFDEYATSRQWMQIEKKYQRIAEKLKKRILKNRSYRLDEFDVHDVEYAVYEGSDAYESLEDSIDFLPDIYDEQIGYVLDLLDEVEEV